MALFGIASHRTAGNYMRFLHFSFVCLAFVGSAAVLMSGQNNVVTWRNDTLRDGLNSSETVLNQSNVAPAQFGKICSTVVDGQLFAQPLVIASGGKNIVYLATMNDSVYAVDGTNCNVITQVSLLQTGEEAVPCGDVGAGRCQTVSPIIGILGTPVIDTTTNTMYVTSETESTLGTCPATHTSDCFFHRIHALDLSTLTEKFNGPVKIYGSYQKAGFTPKDHIQRAGLLLLPHTRKNGDSTVYIGFSEMDGSGTVGVNIPRGWVFGFDAGNLSSVPYIWSSTPAGEGGGLWMTGAGLAAGPDSSGGNTYLYINTGDGDFTANNGGLDYGDSFVKLATNLTTVPNGYFTPFSQACLNVGDEDFGSGGVMLFPNLGSSFFAASAGKDGNIYVMNRANPGGYTPPTNNTCPATGTNANQEYFRGVTGHGYFSTPVYWNSHLFYAPQSAPVVRYMISLVSPPSCTPSPICQTNTASTSNSFQYGPGLSISSSGNTSGTAILWAANGNGWPGNKLASAVLYAYDAEHTASPHTVPELWDSGKCPTRDKIGNSTKFVTPTVANGFVYLGTMDPTDASHTRGELEMFGLTNAACD